MNKAKIETKYLIISFVILIIGIACLFITQSLEKNEYADLQLKAALRMKEAEESLKQEILRRGIMIEEEDLNQTGLIGPEFTELTSTPGEIQAKRTSLNPAFAAAMIRYFYDAGLKEGDTIAIGSSGSFPGFLIAATIAAKEMGLKCDVIASLGASMHGATRLEFNIFDIIKHLQDNEFTNMNLLAISPGSADDKGGGVGEGFFYEGTYEISRQICERFSKELNTEFIYKDSLTESINRRWELYSDDSKLFINIGGASVNSGTSSYTLDFPQGLVLNPPKILQVIDRGLNYEFASKGVPVLNLLNVKLLASQNNINFDEVPFSNIDYSMYVLSTSAYNKTIIYITIALVVLILVFGLYRKKIDSLA